MSGDGLTSEKQSLHGIVGKGAAVYGEKILICQVNQLISWNMLNYIYYNLLNEKNYNKRKPC